MSFTPNTSALEIITTLDWIIFFSVLVLTLLAIIWGHNKKQKNLSPERSFLDHLLMGRELTLPLFVATLVATWYGGVFGVTQIAFEQGIYNFITQGFFWYLTYIIFAFVLIDKIKAYKAITLPDLLRQRLGPRSERLSALFNLLNLIPIAYLISLGLFLKILFGGSLLTNMCLGALFVCLYSAWGGFRAVVYSDLIQFFVMCFGVAAVLTLSLFHFGSPLKLFEQLPPSYSSITGTHSWGETLAWGFIALSTLVDPNFYQRIFAARSTAVAKRGILIATFIWFLFDLCTTFGALYARAIIPNAKSSEAYLLYALQLLPEGLRGLFMAGLLASILSTLDSYLFLSATTLSQDLLPKKWRGKLSVQQVSTFAICMLGIVLAMTFEGNIKNVWKTLGSYSASCLLLPVLASYFAPQHIHDRLFSSACLGGVIVVTLWRHIPLPQIFATIDELYIGLLSTGLTIIFGIAFKKN